MTPVKAAGDVLVNGAVAAAIEDTESTDDVLLSDKAGDGSDSCLPVAPAERSEDPGDCAADGCEDGGVDLILGEHSGTIRRPSRSRW